MAETPCKGEDNLPTLERIIASVLIYSNDGYLLMGRKKSDDGVYPDAWHIPGGGKEDSDADLIQTAIREAQEETGIKLMPEQLTEIVGGKPDGWSKKTIDGVMYNCHMLFNRYKATINLPHNEIPLNSDGDLGGFRWFAPDELEYDEAGERDFYVEPKTESSR
jgi:8-oxo-dGTP pyrophosphatase MutT (NUDIX family)